MENSSDRWQHVHIQKVGIKELRGAENNKNSADDENVKSAKQMRVVRWLLNFLVFLYTEK
jgi:hypothetical protein